MAPSYMAMVRNRQDCGRLRTATYLITLTTLTTAGARVAGIARTWAPAGFAV